MARNTINSRDFDENKKESQLQLKDIEIDDIKWLTDQELWDLVMQYAESTDNWDADVDMEKLAALRDELERRWNEQMQQYWEIRETIENSHYENVGKADHLKGLLDEPDDVIAQKMPWLKSSDKQDNWTENAESLKEQKIKMLNDMYSSIANARRREILKFEDSGIEKDRWYEHNEAYAKAAFQMIIAYETFVKDNEDQLKNLWLEKDINKLYKISQSIRHRYATWEWIMKEAEMYQAFDWIRKYVENLEDGKATRPEFKNSFVDEDLYKEYVTKHGGTTVRNEKII